MTTDAQDACAGPVVWYSAPAEANARPARLAFVDNIRWTMIILVLSMHASDTYSPFGNWYFTDRRPMAFGTAMSFAVYQSFLQAFFMALLFFVSGCFAAPSYDRKGFGRFARDRFVRLGVPTLLYMLSVGPLTQYFLSHSWGGGGFAHQWITHLEDGEWLSETGPMWFCTALLIFSLAYAVLRQTGFLPWRWSGSAITSKWIAGFIAALTVGTFAVRIVAPENRSILNMHFGDFPQYILMFGAGIFAYRGGWLSRTPDNFAARWAVGALSISVLLFAGLIVFGGALHGDTARYNGGLNLVSAGKSLWESLVCVGMSFGLIALYRRFFDRQGPVAKFLSDNAFAVYVFHPPVIVSLALMLRSFEAPALVRAAVLTAAACVATFALCALAMRRIPILRDIL